MLARTHGQPATPTTIGKEFAVFVARAERVLARIEAVRPLGKFSGATGTFAAHVVADAGRRLAGALPRVRHLARPRLEPADHPDRIARLAGGAVRARSATSTASCTTSCTDVWTYISLGYLAQVPQEGATGSSTMPHKINPIRFENAEANFELSSALLDSLAATLVTSRLQRDLTDSTTQRNIGVALGHSLLALDNLARGLGEIAIARPALDADLDANWEVLGEAIQTVIRAEVTAGRSSIADPYALLKELTRGKRVGAEGAAGVRRGARHRRRREGAPARADPGDLRRAGRRAGRLPGLVRRGRLPPSARSSSGRRRRASATPRAAASRRRPATR